MKHSEIISQMTLEEKAAFLSGKNEWQTRDITRLDIPSIFLSDGPHGVRKQKGAGDHLGLNPSCPATCFPAASTIANSWNEELGCEIGRALGEEACALGVNVLLGPGLNMKRSPLCGRNFEYFSEDPYLAGKMAAAYIRGIQSKGVYACPKHFAVNNQELRRMAMNSVVDERTLREIYLSGFEIAVKEGKPGAVMSSYNEVNGTYANENLHLLKEILRDEWGFEGFVVTDWGGSNDHVKGVKAGSDLEMPAPGLASARELVRAVEDGSLTEEELDVCVSRLLGAVMELRNAKAEEGFDEIGHHELAKKAAADSAVLLKNEQGILPLAAGTKVAVIGDFAVEPRYQGAGSSAVNPTFVETIKKKIGGSGLSVVGIAPGYRRTGGADEALKEEALSLAEKADVVLYCFGLDELSESEGLDRIHVKLPQNQTELLKAIYEVNPDIVGLLSGGAAFETPWRDKCKAILHGYLYGQAGAGAMIELLTGKKNPSGKLAETYPLSLEDTPSYENFPGKMRNTEYREGIYIGYRYYDSAGVKAAYPFGYGLSYTEFLYEDLKIADEGVSFMLSNTGGMDGAEIVQLYIGLPDADVFRPKKELKGFSKIYLKAGEKKSVFLPFDDKTFRYWNIESNSWEIEGGVYDIMVAASIEDIRLKGELKVAGTGAKCPYRREKLPSYYSGQIENVGEEEFAGLLGSPVSQGDWEGELGINDALCQMYYAKSMSARLVYKALTRIKEKSEAKGKPDLNILFIYNMPFRAIAKMTGGMVSMEMVEGIVTMVNGRFLKGIKKVIAGFFKNSRANKEYERLLAAGNTNDVDRKQKEGSI